MRRIKTAAYFVLRQLKTFSGFFWVKFLSGRTDNTTQEAAVAAFDSSPLRTMFLRADRCSLSSGAWKTTMLRTTR